MPLLTLPFSCPIVGFTKDQPGDTPGSAPTNFFLEEGSLLQIPSGRLTGEVPVKYNPFHSRIPKDTIRTSRTGQIYLEVDNQAHIVHTNSFYDREYTEGYGKSTTIPFSYLNRFFLNSSNAAKNFHKKVTTASKFDDIKRTSPIASLISIKEIKTKESMSPPFDFRLQEVPALLSRTDSYGFSLYLPAPKTFPNLANADTIFRLPTSHLYLPWPEKLFNGVEVKEIAFSGWSAMFMLPAATAIEAYLEFEHFGAKQNLNRDKLMNSSTLKGLEPDAWLGKFIFGSPGSL